MKKKIGWSLDESTIELGKQLARKLGISFSALITILIREKADKENGKKEL